MWATILWKGLPGMRLRGSMNGFAASASSLGRFSVFNTRSCASGLIPSDDQKTMPTFLYQAMTIKILKEF
jgi:hypothetical protein